MKSRGGRVVKRKIREGEGPQAPMGSAGAAVEEKKPKKRGRKKGWRKKKVEAEKVRERKKEREKERERERVRSEETSINVPAYTAVAVAFVLQGQEDEAEEVGAKEEEMVEVEEKDDLKKEGGQEGQGDEADPPASSPQSTEKAKEASEKGEDRRSRKPGGRECLHILRR